MNKATYKSVAKTINAALRVYQDGTFKPAVTVRDTSDQGRYCDKWSLAVNDDLYDLIQRPGIAQNLFYADEIYTYTQRDGRDFDMYIEPFNSWLFNLAVL
jgi:hypothetical protein